MENKSIWQIVKYLRSQNDLNEHAYARLLQHIFWFAYILPGLFFFLPVFNYIQIIFRPEIFFLGLPCLIIHIKVKNHYLQTVQLYTFGHLTEGEVLKKSDYSSHHGFALSLKCRITKSGKMENMHTSFYNHWAGRITEIKIVDCDEKALYQSIKKGSFRGHKYSAALMGKKLYVLYLPSKLKRLNEFSRIFSLVPSGLTVYSSGVADCSCLSKQRYAEYLSTIDIREREQGS